jgi:Flp pilus assembly protein TadB
VTKELALFACAIIGGCALIALLDLVRQILFPAGSKRLQNVMESHENLAHLSRAEVSITSAARQNPPPRKDTALSICRRLRYARWKLSPFTYYLLAAAISGSLFALVAPHLNGLLRVCSLLAGPCVMRGVLNRCIDRRSNRFDADYPQFLMSVVGLLKTGMTPSGALETAARGLEINSLVREEVLLMLERVRLGILEDRSIGAFGEDIHHPEIELFVQALLLSYRIGGNLSESIERLSRQVRRRQYFKSSAHAAVGLQRGSITLITVILIGLQGYIALIFPNLMLASLNHEIGWQIWQCAGLCVIISFIWIRQVTQMKL